MESAADGRRFLLYEKCVATPITGQTGPQLMSPLQLCVSCVVICVVSNSDKFSKWNIGLLERAEGGGRGTHPPHSVPLTRAQGEAQ